MWPPESAPGFDKPNWVEVFLRAILLRARRRRIVRVALGASVAIVAAVGVAVPLTAPMGIDRHHLRAAFPSAGVADAPPITFAASGEWRTVMTTSQSTQFTTWPDSPTTWAANVPFDAADIEHVGEGGYLHASFGPWRTIETLPSTGIVILGGYNPGAPTETPLVDFPERSLPLDIGDARDQPKWEGQTNPNVQKYALTATISGRRVTVDIFFGSAPDGAVLEAAQLELTTMVVPSSA